MKFFLSRFLFASAALFTVSVNSFSVEQPSISRRSLLAEGASVAATIWTIAAPTAMAAVEDLSMPIADEQKKMEQDAMEERLRRKAELQRQAAQPKTFADSFKNEMQKQNQLKSQTKEERRNAMCEELGRGC